MKKPTVKKKTTVKAKKPSPAPVISTPAPQPADAAAKPLPKTAAELRAQLGITYDHVFVAPSGRQFKLLAVEGNEAVMQCQDCGEATRVPLEAVMKAEIRTEVSERDDEESDLPDFPEGHPIGRLLKILQARGARVHHIGTVKRGEG